MKTASTFVILLMGISITQVLCSGSSPAELSSNAPSSLPKPSQDVADTSTLKHTLPYATSVEENVNPNTPWILPGGFDKNRIFHLGKDGNKCWQSAKYKVCLTKTQDNTKLYWNNKKSNILVNMDISSNGDYIDQDWKYNKDLVHINTQDDGSTLQTWKFGISTLAWERNPDGKITSRWYGPENPEAVEKFKKFINSWCDNNDYFVGKENCAVYDKIIIDNNPAWILPGFDKNQAPQSNKNGRKWWKGAKYYACLTKTQDRTDLRWKNGKHVQVTMTISNDGDVNYIDQDWKYLNDVVHINTQDNGSTQQTWKFGNSTLVWEKNLNGKITSLWYGPENPQAVEKFKKFIDSWCDNNDFFVEKDDCVIYSK